jgi:AraC family transcriptional regulator, transcriptional activator of pobA
MPVPAPARESVPAWNLYGEDRLFPDILHVERIRDRAAEHGWRIHPHRHLLLHQFFLIRAGGAVFEADGRSLTLVPPCVLSVPRMAVHGFAFSAGTEGHVVTLPVANLPVVFEPGTASAQRLARVRHLVPDPDLAAAFDRLHQEHAGRATARALMLVALATELVCLVLRRLAAAGGDKALPLDPRLQHFLDAVEDGTVARRSIDDCARDVGLSSRQLRRLCVAATGAAPAVHLEAALMREARRMLAYTRMPVASVAFALGFEDAAYFSRFFRRHAGLAPKAYRRLVNEDGSALPVPNDPAIG